MNDFLAMSEEQWQSLIDSAPEGPDLGHSDMKADELREDISRRLATKEYSDDEIKDLLMAEGFDKLHATKVDQMEGRCLKFAERLADRFIAGEKIMAYLWGIRGTGKTQIAARVGFRMRKASQGVGRRVLVSEYLKLLKSSYNGNMEQKQTIRNLTLRMENAPLLVLDEFTEIRGNEFEQEELTRIVDKRYGKMVPTLIIGNDKPEDAMNILGPSIWSRLQENGGLIECDWESYRVAGK